MGSLRVDSRRSEASSVCAEVDTRVYPVCQSELRRISLPHALVNKGKKEGRGAMPRPSAVV
jgi:hypothetical protein